MSMKIRSAKGQRGFSLLELLIAMALLAVVVGAIAVQIGTAHQRAAFERTQLDLFQEAREFMDQMSRDLRQVGYPNPRNFNSSILGTTATSAGDTTTSTLAAVGLTEAQPTDLWFEGGTDYSGNVLFTQYHYNPSTTGGCPCLQRSQQTRAGTPNSETANYTSEVQNVQNYLVTPAIPIFRYYANGGTTEVVPSSSASLPASPDWGGNSGGDNAVLASIDTIRIQLMVQSPYVDLKTGLAPTVMLVSTVKANNCSQATTGQLSCAN
jgi:prepilin-type N-terminal cleavage/methylation domain-containing protein